MRISTWRGVIGCAWLLGACGDPSTGDETGASSTATTSGASTTSGATTLPGTTAGDASAGGTSSTTAADSSGPASGPGESSTSSSGGGETSGTCEPTPPAGDVCLECVVAHCCTAWAACQADEPCACVVDCHVVGGGSLGMCSNQCNLDSDLYQALYFCGQGSCLGMCEWDCC